MIRPAVERFRRVIRKGIEGGELRADLDADLAADAVFGSFFTRFYERGRPGRSGRSRWSTSCTRIAVPCVSGDHVNKADRAGFEPAMGL